MECKIKNVSINYEIIGEGKPIVMLHGYYLEHRMMAGCMEPVFSDKDGYKRIYLDLPGMGKSEGAEWIKSSDDMLDILISFIDKIIPNENFLLAGQSYGGYLARGIIHKMADRIDGMLLICPLIIPDHKKRRVEENVVLLKDDKLLSKLPEEDAEDLNYAFVVQSKRIYERWKNELMPGFDMADGDFLQRIQQNGYGFSFDVDKADKKVDKPVLILLGKQDICVGYKDAWNILENFPRATFSILDRAGHQLHIEQEKLFNSLINDWLVRVKEA
ncbi:alpha/beta fold hydrolase [Oceanirhabdus seepicola]|uniref:Alpha/beta hydrolase n=1 Tax=Oceanirhabdus seepicola TaxID=2828781 RepID=A0A9J6NXW3_9CLOT|nr:alpha/beta hydrolase [Oceanirhabdus seepicola]MCM1989359.1 alpha/beta hydrolase [Oceanirhabdus seepicola]